jgi:hypothetical protein
MSLPHLDRLFQIITEEGESYYVVADTFAQAVENYQSWSGCDEGEEPREPNSVIDVGWLIKTPETSK